MWKIVKSENVEKQLVRDFRANRLDRDDIIVIRKWVDDMEELGPEWLLGSQKYDDHHLEGQWFGYRSACFSPLGRIIYRVLSKKWIEIIRITPNHDYSGDIK